MKRKLLALVAAGVCSLVVAGCVSTVGGKMTMGLPGKDTIQSRYERPPEQLFEAAKQVLKFNGTLYGENTINHTLEAKIDTRTVWVKVEPVEPKITQVSVQARTKSGTGDVKLASEIDKQIALRLVTAYQ